MRVWLPNDSTKYGVSSNAAAAELLLPPCCSSETISSGDSCKQMCVWECMCVYVWMRQNTHKMHTQCKHQALRISGNAFKNRQRYNGRHKLHCKRTQNIPITSIKRLCHVRNDLFPNRMGCFIGGISVTQESNWLRMFKALSIAWATGRECNNKHRNK